MQKFITAVALVVMTAGPAFARPIAPPPRVPQTPQTPQSPGPRPHIHYTIGAAFPYPGAQREIFGVIRAIDGTNLTVQTRRGNILVDASWATTADLISPLSVSRTVLIHGVFRGNTLFAHDVVRSNLTNPASWPPDR